MASAGLRCIHRWPSTICLPRHRGELSTLKILITGICGFVGSNVARAFIAQKPPHWQIFGVDNFIRPGSEVNREGLRRQGVKLSHGDLRAASDFDTLPAVDWVIDAAANPSVLAGVDGKSSSRQVVEHNVVGTINLLEYCRRCSAGIVLLSTSRVYSIPLLAGLPVISEGARYRLVEPLPAGVSAEGLDETFSVAPPVSLYGATKRASEVLALEYGESFNLPVWINRCGVLAGAGQFGRVDQGILAYWLNAYLRRKPLSYIGFQGSGHQTRDAFHPRDLAMLLIAQLEAGPRAGRPNVVNVGGGSANSFSLAEVTAWCERRFGFQHPVKADLTPRLFDVPWLVMDNRTAAATWDWRPGTSLEAILQEIASHAEAHPEWLQKSAPF